MTPSQRVEEAGQEYLNKVRALAELERELNVTRLARAHREHRIGELRVKERSVREAVERYHRRGLLGALVDEAQKEVDCLQEELLQLIKELTRSEHLLVRQTAQEETLGKEITKATQARSDAYNALCWAHRAALTGEDTETQEGAVA